MDSTGISNNNKKKRKKKQPNTETIENKSLYENDFVDGVFNVGFKWICYAGRF